MQSPSLFILDERTKVEMARTVADPGFLFSDWGTAPIPSVCVGEGEGTDLLFVKEINQNHVETKKMVAGLVLRHLCLH